jgi:glycosyltransferase involved in cell wall biosynthesis
LKVLFVCSGNKSLGKPSVLVKNQADSLIEKGLKLTYTIISQKGIIGYLKAVIPIYKSIKNDHVKIVHAHYSLTAFAASLAVLLINKNRPKLVVSLMGSDAQMKGWKRKLTNLFSEKLWFVTIVKSQQMAVDLGLKTFTVIPNGVQIEKFYNQEETIENKILFAADPSRESKNFELAKKAVDIAKKSQPTINLKVVYNVEHTEIIKEIKSSACILSTSKWEGSPNIIKESLVCNRPIVATNVGDIAWLLENVEGCFITNFDAELIAQSILKSLEFNKENKYTKGLEKIKELQLDAQSIANRLLTIYGY